jgi:DNA-directed RNA polymerase subunit M/transcription elongation factor TFIIS
MLITNPEQFRQNVVLKLDELLENNTNAINMEKAVFNYALREAGHRKILRKWANNAFSQLYTDHLRTIYMNLPNQIEHIKSGEITVQQYVFMTHQEMKPERWRELLEKKNTIDANKFTTKMEASTDMFVCPQPKCRSRRCTYYTLQVRSADEPESVFVSCLDCGKNFRRG